MIRLAAIALFILILGHGQACAAEGNSAAQDMMCGNAPQGSVVALPESVRDWVIVLCTPAGQALGPVEQDRMTLWIAANEKPFLLYAFPTTWNKPESISKYELRFVQFFAVERSGEALEKTLKMWDLGFGAGQRPKIDKVVQLDAQSAYQGTLYNLFFYISEGRPKWLIACINQCASSAPIRIIEK